MSSSTSSLSQAEHSSALQNEIQQSNGEEGERRHGGGGFVIIVNVIVLPPSYLLLSATTIATVPTVATAAPVLTSTPYLENPSIVALSSLLSLALWILFFDYNAPESLWLSLLLSLDVALVILHPQLGLFVCTGWFLHLILSCCLHFPSLRPFKALLPLNDSLHMPTICHLFARAALPLVMLLTLHSPVPLVCPGWLLHHL